MDDARLRFLFGRVPEPDRYADESGRLDLLEADRSDGRTTMRAVIAGQVLADEPPAVWAAATRLLAAGLARHEAMDQLVTAVRPMVAAAAMHDAAFDATFDNATTDDAALDDARVEGMAFGEAEYLAALDRLPLPSTAEVTAVYVAAAREALVVSAVELEQRVIERLGLPMDDPVVEFLVDDVDRDLHESGDSPLIMMPPDLVVHLPALVDGSVLTHRLSGVEQVDGTLDLLPDLAPFARIPSPHTGEVTLFVEDGRWFGPPDWLADLPTGALLAVRAREDGAVSVAALDVTPEPAGDLAAALRTVYDIAVEEPGLPVDGEELVAGLLHRDADAFAEPRPPLSELAAAAGLEQRDGEFAHDASVWRRGEELGRLSRLMGVLGSDARAAMDAYSLLTEDADDPAALRTALDLMEDPEILEVVLDELFEDDDPERVSDVVGLGDRLVSVAGRSVRGAVACAVAAVAAERDGRPLDAESYLRTGSRMGEGWDFVEDRLAWYASDRGAAAEALARWEAMGAPRGDTDLAVLMPFAATVPREMGRNEPCWCGSGRKFKQCHRGKVEQAPLADRVDWLAHKSVAYLVRRGGLAGAIGPYLAARYAGLDDPPALDPLTVDVALVEGGLFARFVAERGALLPADELMLAQAWLLVERSVYEVTDVEPRGGVAVRDLRTGDRLDVRDFGARAGELVCARFVPDGVGHRLLGARFSVDPGRERQLLPLLDDGDGLGLLEWVAAREGGPHVVSAEGDGLMLCTAVVTMPDGAAEVLDKLFEPAETGWVWSADVDDERVRMLARVLLDGNRLVASTITERRMDDLLALLAENLPGCAVVSDVRELPDLDGAPPEPAAPLDPAVLDDVQNQMERRWCDEPVPALGGLRPRDAANDPTRRDDVARLIASFPEIAPETGAFGLRPDRLRELLGLS